MSTAHAKDPPLLGRCTKKQEAASFRSMVLVPANPDALPRPSPLLPLTIQLGDKFDIRAFHSAVLEQGAIPLDILEHNIEAYIASEETSP